MIDWLNLLFNSIWIIAIAIALAVFSITYYHARQTEEKWKDLLKHAEYAFPLNIAGAIFCLGMAVTSARWWEVLLWIVLMGLFGYQIFQNIKYKM